MDMMGFNQNYTSDDLLESALLHARWQTKLKKWDNNPHRGIPEVTQAVAAYVRDYLDREGYEMALKK